MGSNYRKYVRRDKTFFDVHFQPVKNLGDDMRNMFLFIFVIGVMVMGCNFLVPTQTPTQDDTDTASSNMELL
jgi:hypothetical protein